MGLNKSEGPVPQSSPDRKFVIKTKTFGRTEHDIPEHKINDKNRNIDSNQDENNETYSEREFSEYLEKMSETFHLEYEVEDESKIIQVRVVNTEDGTIVRKIPPDKIIETAGIIRKKLINTSIDIKA